MIRLAKEKDIPQIGDLLSQVDLVHHPVLTDIKTLYIDDLCVDEGLRGKHIGKELYEAAAQLASAGLL